MNREDRELINYLTTPHEAKDCEGVSRRQFLKVGLTTLIGLTFADLLQLRALASPVGGKKQRYKSCIMLFMGGGPSHLDTFDPKPEAGSAFAGTFNSTKTNVPGVHICEHLPKLATQMDKMALIRSMHSGEASHERGQHYMQTGYLPLPTLEYPSFGSVVAKERNYDGVLPPYVLLHQTVEGQEAGFLGQEFNGFFAGDPNRGAFQLPDGTPPGNVDLERVARRKELMMSFDAMQRDQDRVKSMDQYYQRAYSLMESKQARQAFEISKEPDTMRDAYGRTGFGQSCLLARRMVEAGVPFVTVTQHGWDTHANNFEQLKNNVLPNVDRAISTLLTDLQSRGLLESTLVVWTGEFGRTPTVNKDAGRDHWANAWTVMMAGGGVQGGRVIGATDEKGMQVKDRPVTPEDLAATIYHALEIDPHKYYETPTGRPIKLAQGSVIRELF